MKKPVSMLMVLVLSLCAPQLGAMAEPASLGLERTLTPNADGSAVLSMAGEGDEPGAICFERQVDEPSLLGEG